MNTRMMEAIAKALAPPIRRLMERVDALESELKAMQASQNKSLADQYAGTWRTDHKYERGTLTTHKGALWLSLSDTEAAPATDSSWRMVSKKDFGRTA